MANSRAKGIRGELELAAFFKEHGIDARRGQQFSGGPGSPDVVHDLPGVHVECKRTESLQLWPALAQATRDAPVGCTPVVFHRPSRRPWIVILDASIFLQLVKDANRGKTIRGPGASGEQDTPAD